MWGCPRADPVPPKTPRFSNPLPVPPEPPSVLPLEPDRPKDSTGYFLLPRRGFLTRLCWIFFFFLGGLLIINVPLPMYSAL